MTLEESFNESVSVLLDLVQKKLPDATYISFLLFNKGKLIKSINNNYNNWAKNYNETDMLHDNVFYEISHKNIMKCNNTICFWNSVPHTSETSLEIHQRRATYGLYNGITILEAMNESYTLGINITSNNSVNEDMFYSKAILKRRYFMQKLREILKITSDAL